MFLQYLVPATLVGLLGILSFLWWKRILNDRSERIYVIFYVCDVQNYFEGLVWDLRRILNWRNKEASVFVIDVGSIDDTLKIIKRLEQKGFLRQLSFQQAEKIISDHKGKNNWIFNLREETEVKEIRKCFVKIFTEPEQNSRQKTELF